MFPVSDSDVRPRGHPVVNVILIGLCAAVFVYELAIGSSSRAVFFHRFGLIPNELVHGIDYKLLITSFATYDIGSPIPSWATMFTSMFIHGDWMHFATNMLFLWVFGRNLEDKFGHLRYLLFYIAAGVAAAWLQIATNTVSEIPVIGASGAIAGIVGSYLFLFPYSRITTVVVFFFITVVRIPAVYLLGFWFLLQFVGGVGSLGPSAQTGSTAYWAHVGGFLLGVAAVIIYKLATHQTLWPKRPGVPHFWRGGRL